MNTLVSGVTKEDEQCDPIQHAISYTDEPGTGEPHSMLAAGLSKKRKEIPR